MITLFEGEFATRDTLRYIEEKGGIGLWAWDLRTDEMIWSRGLFALLGLDPGEIKPSYQKLSAAMHPDDRLSPVEMQHRVRSGHPLTRQFRIVQRNGRMRWIASRGEVLLNERGETIRAIGAFFDISREQQAIADLAIAEDRRKALVAALGVSSWISGPQGECSDPTWIELTQLSTEAALEGNWLIAVHGDERSRVATLWTEAKAARSVFKAQCRIGHAELGYRWVNLRAAPIPQSDGSIREWVWTSSAADNDLTNPRVNAPDLDPANPPLLTAAQLRAARGLLNWSVRELSDISGVSLSIIRRLEEFDATKADARDIVDRLRTTLEENGVQFLFPASGPPGVRNKARVDRHR